jgi:antitoxin ParD1/3/4
MVEMERSTITLPAEVASLVMGAVDGGDFASSSEVIREAPRDWKLKRELQLHEIAALRAEIVRVLADVGAGRLVDFSADCIRERQAVIGGTFHLRLAETAEAC